MEGFVPNWRFADVDTDRLWAASECAELTAEHVATPHTMIREVVGLARYLDDNGGHFAATHGHEGLGVLSQRGKMLGYGRSGATSCNGSSHMVQCADGWIALTLSRDDDVQLVPAWLEHDVVGSALDVVRAVAHERSAVELAARAGEMGLACFVVGETIDGVAVKATCVGDHVPSELNDVWLANLASLWAGPLAANTLSWMGAGVLTVESATRPDGARQTPEFYRSLHQLEELMVIPFAEPHGQYQLQQLLKGVDVVIEGSRPRALRQLGIDARAMAETGPRIWVSITAAGRDNDHEHRVGFGDDAAAGGGLVGWVDDAPVFLADAIADPISGLVVAATIHQLVTSGGRWLVDIALSRVARSVSR